MSRPRLFVGRRDRLIARLKMMLYAWRFIDAVGGQLFVAWPALPERYADEDVDYSPHLLFDTMRFYAQGGADRLQFLETDKPLPKEAVELDAPGFAARAKDGFPRAMFAAGGAYRFRGSAHYFLDDEPDSLDHRLDGVRRLFRQLPIDPEIDAARSGFYHRAGIEPGSFCALHVRRGDVFAMLRDELPGNLGDRLTEKRLHLIVGHYVARTAPLEFYEDVVAAAIADRRRLVFTSDTPETISWFRQRFGHRNFLDLSRVRMPIAIQKAFLDFLILCDADEIIGTSSNFSAFAAELGQARFTNVAARGELDVARDLFVAEFLAGDTVDGATRDAAIAIMEDAFRDMRRRREASERARALKKPNAQRPRLADPHRSSGAAL